MEVLEAKKHLPSDQLDKRLWDALFLVAFNESQEVLSKRFENDAYMVLWPRVRERIEERNDVGTTRMSRICV